MWCGNSLIKIENLLEYQRNYENGVPCTLKRRIHSKYERHKDYKCEYCGKSFSQTDDLKKHFYIIHEGQRKNDQESGFLNEEPISYIDSNNVSLNQGNDINTVDKINQIKEDDHKDINLVSKIQIFNENELFPNLVECSICEIAFCGTNATLEKHMFDAHKGQKDT